MKLKRESRTLKAKALASLRRAMEVFNSHDDVGRVESVLLHLQHSSEMLVKALLHQKGEMVFDTKVGMSIGLESGLKKALTKRYLTEGQVGTIRAVDAMRDEAQHWMIVVAEELLFLHSRALVTVIDEILIEHFDDTLASNLPLRVLPISTLPVTDIQTLVDREYTQIKELLAPGKRARDEARGRIRTLLALEGHVATDVGISEKDVDRIERAAKGGTDIWSVFPRLGTLSADVAGEGVTIKVRFGKGADLPAVQYIASDDPSSAAAIREVDLQKKYHLSAQELAGRLKLTTPRAKALRDYLGIDADQASTHCFQFGSQSIVRYSDNALRAMQTGNTPHNLAVAWARAKGRPDPPPPLPPPLPELPSLPARV